MFWAPGAEKCEKAPQSRLFAPKRTFRAKVAFGRKSAFRAQKGILGDSGGISIYLTVYFIRVRAFCGFWDFRDAEMEFMWKYSRLHVIFMEKWILCLFTTFRAASRKTPSDFATPLMLFSLEWRVPRWIEESPYILWKVTILVKTEHFRWNSTKMEVLGWF